MNPLISFIITTAVILSSTIPFNNGLSIDGPLSGLYHPNIINTVLGSFRISHLFSIEYKLKGFRGAHSPKLIWYIKNDAGIKPLSVITNRMEADFSGDKKTLYCGGDGSYRIEIYRNSLVMYKDGQQCGVHGFSKEIVPVNLIGTTFNLYYGYDTDLWLSDINIHTQPTEWAAQYNVGGWRLFEGAGQWYECPKGFVVAGFYKNYCQSLYCLEEMRCVAPQIYPMVDQTCYDKDIVGAFDGAGTVECDAGYFVNAIWSNNNQNGQCGIYCWEYLRCCKYDTNRLIDNGKTETQNWWSCFDGSRTGWCLVDNDEYITGFTRTAGNGQLYQLEEAKVRKLSKSASVVGVPETPQFEERPSELNKPFGDVNYVEISKPVFLVILGLIAAVIVVNIIMMCCVKKNKGEVQGYGVVKQVDSDSEAV